MQSSFSRDILFALLGGSMIGFATCVLWLSIGRLSGISGILYEGLLNLKSQNRWRWSFLTGLLIGGLLLQIFAPTLLVNTLQTQLPIVIAAGLLVGFGTRLGGGCTSGHGICGVGRLSKRSIVATLIFVGTGIVVATLVKKIGIA